jgi:hypothetical protein
MDTSCSIATTWIYHVVTWIYHVVLATQALRKEAPVFFSLYLAYTGKSESSYDHE